MTPREHLLMLLLLFDQRRAIRILLDILKSREVLKEDDEQAFQFVQTINAAQNAAIFEELKLAYMKLAS